MPSRDAQALARQLIAASRSGGVGGVAVQPRYVGGVEVQPMHVGAPAQLVPQAGAAPINYSPEMYTAGDVSYLGLGITVVAAGAVNQQIPVRPVRPFKPQQLYCPSTVIGLQIIQILVGGIDLLAAPGVPIELLSEVSTCPPIDWPTVDPAVGITFGVSNPTGGALNFSGSLYGTSVRR